MSLIKKLKKCILHSVIKPSNDFVLSHHFINYSPILTSPALIQKCSPSVPSLQFHKGYLLPGWCTLGLGLLAWLAHGVVDFSSHWPHGDARTFGEGRNWRATNNLLHPYIIAKEKPILSYLPPSSPLCGDCAIWMRAYTIYILLNSPLKWDWVPSYKHYMVLVTKGDF